MKNVYDRIQTLRMPAGNGNADRLHGAAVASAVPQLLCNKTARSGHL